MIYKHSLTLFLNLLFIDLATRLVGALEESLQGESKCSVETFENYNEQITIYTQSLMKSDAITVKAKSSFQEISIKNWN